MSFFDREPLFRSTQLPSNRYGIPAGQNIPQFDGSDFTQGSQPGLPRGTHMCNRHVNPMDVKTRRHHSSTLAKRLEKFDANWTTWTAYITSFLSKLRANPVPDEEAKRYLVMRMVPSTFVMLLGRLMPDEECKDLSLGGYIVRLEKEFVDYFDQWPQFENVWECVEQDRKRKEVTATLVKERRTALDGKVGLASRKRRWPHDSVDLDQADTAAQATPIMEEDNRVNFLA